MKKIVTYILLTISFFGFSQSNLIETEVDTTNIRIGEQFQYKISVNTINDVIIPKLSLNGLEVIDSTKIDTINNKLVKKYFLTGFDSGAYYIPQQQIFIKNQAHLTDSLLINVSTVAIDTTKIKKFPIKGIKNEPYQLNDFRHLWWIPLLIALLIGVFVFLLLRIKKKKTVEEVIIPQLEPYDEAVEKLKNLDNKLLWQNNKIKQYYSELTDIVRNYIEREFNIPTLENTTDEIIKSLFDSQSTGVVKTDKEIITKLKKLLEEADLVKFAKYKPLSHEIEEDRKTSEEIINNLKPKPSKEDEEVVA